MAKAAVRRSARASETERRYTVSAPAAPRIENRRKIPYRGVDIGRANVCCELIAPGQFTDTAILAALSPMNTDLDARARSSERTGSGLESFDVIGLRSDSAQESTRTP